MLTYSENREKRRERDQSEDRDGKERRRRRRSVSRSSRAEKITVNNGKFVVFPSNEYVYNIGNISWKHS